MLPFPLLEAVVTHVVVAGGSTHEMSPNNIAWPWHIGGCAVIPIRPGGSKAPFFDWKNGPVNYQRTRPTDEDVRHWFEVQYRHAGVAVICGSVSGNLEMLELEGRSADADSLSKIIAECELRAVTEVWANLRANGYVEWTPSGGIHLLYRITDHEVPGNRKLASRPAYNDEYTEEELEIVSRRPDFRPMRVLAETRGEGGYVVVAPTGGHCHKTGEPWTTASGRQGVLPAISWSQRMAIHAAIEAALDQSPPAPEPVAKQLATSVSHTAPGELSPAEDFNLRASWEDPWFTSQGWRISHRSAGEIFWTRPGKSAGDGHSASTGYAGDADRLFIWSTSTDLPAEAPLSKFFVYSHYHFKGDMSAAARALRKDGYGTKTQDPEPLHEIDLGQDDAGQEIDLPVHTGWDLTDTGYGRRMRELFGDRFRYNTVEKQWYVWTGTAWEPDRILAIHRAAENSAQEVLDQAIRELQQAEGTPDEKQARAHFRDAKLGLNNGRLQAAVTRFQCQPGIAVVPQQFDQETRLLNLPNGTLDLETEVLHPHDPADMLTLTFGAAYDPDAMCPRFEQFMRDILPSEPIRDYVQRALGYTLLGRPTQRAMFLLHGPSGTGKSVLTSLMTKVFGGYGATAPATTFRLKKNETSVDVHRLKGKRFVATSEMPEGALLDEELVKRITGGDCMTSRSLYEDYQEWKAQCVIWIATNFLPRVTGDDNAIWRRAKSIPMRTEFGSDSNPEILGYADVLIEERDGILNWLLAGLRDYQLQGGLAQPQEITDDINSYRIDVDTAASFLRDKIDDGVLVAQPGAQIRSSILNTLYVSYCNENRVQPMGVRRFAKRLRSLGEFEPTKIGGQAMWMGLHYMGEGNL